MKKNEPLQFCNETIQPGEHISLALPLPELFSCAPLFMPIKVIHGKQAGPCLLITSAMHGNELNGTEIINRLFNNKSLQRLRGTLIAVPVLNVYGLINRSRTLPGGINLDRCFPGSKNGTHAARVAHLFSQEVFHKADITIDLQSGFINYTNLPHIYINFHDEQAKELATAFNAPVISHLPSEKGSLRRLAFKKRKPFLLYEGGEAMRFHEHSIKVGVKGILNVLRYLEMLPEKPQRNTTVKSLFAEQNTWVYAPTSGISHSQLELGQFVNKGDILCTISDPFGGTESTVVKSPADATIVGKNNLPLVHEGEGLFQLAVFSETEGASTQLESWEKRNKASPS